MADFGITEGLLLAGTVLSVASTGLATYSAVSQADYNKKVANANAQASLDQANYSAQRLRERNQRTLGSQRANAAAHGLALDSGSYNDIMTDSSIQGELDVQAELYKGRIGAARQYNEANLDTMRGNSALASGIVSGTGSAVGGANKIYNANTLTSSTSATALDF